MLKIDFLHDVVKVAFIVIGQNSRLFLFVENTLGLLWLLLLLRGDYLLDWLYVLLAYLGTY